MCHSLVTSDVSLSRCSLRTMNTSCCFLMFPGSLELLNAFAFLGKELLHRVLRNFPQNLGNFWGTHELYLENQRKYCPCGKTLCKKKKSILQRKYFPIVIGLVKHGRCIWFILCPASFTKLAEFSINMQVIFNGFFKISYYFSEKQQQDCVLLVHFDFCCCFLFFFYSVCPSDTVETHRSATWTSKSPSLVTEAS